MPPPLLLTPLPCIVKWMTDEDLLPRMHIPEWAIILEESIRTVRVPRV